MKPIFLYYPKCSTCQRAQKWLESHSVEVEHRDITTYNPNAAELDLWIKRSSLPTTRFFNTSGLKYRALNLKDVLPTASHAQMLDILASDGMLVKRPLLILADRVLVGFREAEWADALL